MLYRQHLKYCGTSGLANGMLPALGRELQRSLSSHTLSSALPSAGTITSQKRDFSSTPSQSSCGAGRRAGDIGFNAGFPSQKAGGRRQAGQRAQVPATFYQQAWTASSPTGVFTGRKWHFVLAHRLLTQKQHHEQICLTVPISPAKTK